MTLHATFRRGQYCVTGTLEARENGLRCGGPWECRAGGLRPINAVKVDAEVRAEIAELETEFGRATQTIIIEE